MKKRTIIYSLVILLWISLALLLWFGSRTDISDSERRKLAQLPKISIETVKNGKFMEKFDDFTRDQFPFREGFRSLNALFSTACLGKKDTNGIYVVENQAVKLEYPLNESAVLSAKEKLQGIYEQYLTEQNRVFLTVVPDKGYYLAEKYGYPAMDYDALFAHMQSLDFVRYVDITDLLTAQDYYSTDLHWRQERLLNAAQRLCEALGAPTGVYTERMLTDCFSGVYAGQSALPMGQDSLFVLENAVLENCTVEIGGKTSKIYDLEKLKGRDPYEVFLSGSVGAMTVHNPAGTPGRSLIVFRDSFGSSLVPLLLQGYETVTLLDIRYYPASRLKNVVEFTNQDVLFLYSTTVLNTPGIFK